MDESEQDEAGRITSSNESQQRTDDSELYSAPEDQNSEAGTSQTATSNTQRTIREMLDGEGNSSVFVNRDLVEPETIIDEERIVGRDDQLESVVSFLRPALQGNRPPNMLLYGPAGTGKSLIINAVTQQITDLCKSNGLSSVLSTLTAKRLIRSIKRYTNS
nr:AAA family ATPase [Haloterrigena gelatinilytica]